VNLKLLFKKLNKQINKIKEDPDSEHAGMGRLMTLTM
jgi:hypothetical protein